MFYECKYGLSIKELLFFVALLTLVSNITSCFYINTCQKAPYVSRRDWPSMRGIVFALQNKSCLTSSLDKRQGVSIKYSIFNRDTVMFWSTCYAHRPREGFRESWWGHLSHDNTLLLKQCTAMRYRYYDDCLVLMCCCSEYSKFNLQWSSRSLICNER